MGWWRKRRTAVQRTATTQALHLQRFAPQVHVSSSGGTDVVKVPVTQTLKYKTEVPALLQTNYRVMPKIVAYTVPVGSKQIMPATRSVLLKGNASTVQRTTWELLNYYLKIPQVTLI